MTEDIVNGIRMKNYNAFTSISARRGETAEIDTQERANQGNVSTEQIQQISSKKQ